MDQASQVRPPMSPNEGLVKPQMKVVEVIYRFRPTEAVFKRYDQKAGECICCQALFDSVGQVAVKYGLDLAELLTELNKAAKGS